MADVLKQSFDVKTVVIILIYITGLVANNLKNDYSNKIAIKDQEAKYEDRFNKLENKITELRSDIKNRDDLQDRDILKLEEQQTIGIMTDKAQGFLLDNIQKNMNK